MALPVTWYSVSVGDSTKKADGSAESANWQVPITTMTAANHDTLVTAVGALQTAVTNLTLGNSYKKEIVNSRVLISNDPVANSAAQRENKFLCRYHDVSTGQKFRVSLPTADLTALMSYSEFVDLTAGVGLALKTAFEAVVVSPANSSNATVLDSVQFVGRNS